MSAGCLAMAVANGLNGLYAYAVHNGSAETHLVVRTSTITHGLLNSLSTWWPAVGFSLWFCSYSIGMANALHLVMGEMLPSQVYDFLIT
jgi:hypothetical protein